MSIYTNVERESRYLLNFSLVWGKPIKMPSANWRSIGALEAQIHRSKLEHFVWNPDKGVNLMWNEKKNDFWNFRRLEMKWPIYRGDVVVTCGVPKKFDSIILKSGAVKQYSRFCSIIFIIEWLVYAVITWNNLEKREKVNSYIIFMISR